MQEDWSSCRRNGMTLVELLVVISIVGILTALALPAINIARASGRTAKCQMNLKHLGVAILAHSERSRGKFCTGAFSWRDDGNVTEVGWVADIVNSKVPVGKMLCPANTYRVSETYVDLLGADTSTFDNCVQRMGRPGGVDPDGTERVNACRQIIESNMPAGSPGRQQLVLNKIFKKHYNTNYTASWYMVRGDIELGPSGNLISRKEGCAPSTRSIHSTRGPLTSRYADGAHLSTSFIPILGDGAPTNRVLEYELGEETTGIFTTRSFTKGPVLKTTMGPPNFPDGTPQTGPDGWWAAWSRQVLQDYRGFAPLHGGLAVVLFADGSSRKIKDVNRDGFLNNGFPATAANGFSDGTVELSLEEFSSLYSLRAKVP